MLVSLEELNEARLEENLVDEEVELGSGETLVVTVAVDHQVALDDTLE